MKIILQSSDKTTSKIREKNFKFSLSILKLVKKYNLNPKNQKKYNKVIRKDYKKIEELVI